MPRIAPPPQVRSAFAVSGPLRYHHGNFGGVWSNGTMVLKQVHDVTETTTTAELLEHVEVAGVRLPTPVRATDGRFVVDGWCASTHLAGRRLSRGRWADRIAASRAISRACSSIERPAFFDTQDHMWARGARIAWGEDAWTPPAEWAELADRLRAGAGDFDPPRQLIHGDIAGNVISASGLPLGVVDFSPTWQSALWSDCMVVTDGLLWFAAPPRIVDYLDDDATGPILCRTTLFRLIVHCLWFGDTSPTDTDVYEPVVDLVTSL